MRIDVALNDAKVAILGSSQVRPHARLAARSQLIRILPAAAVAASVAFDAVLIATPFMPSRVLSAAPSDGVVRASLSDAQDWMAVIVALLAVAFLGLRGLYDFSRARSWPSQLYAAGSAISVALVGAVVLSDFIGLPTSGTSTIASAALAIPVVTIWHVGVRRGCVVFARALLPARRVIIVGANAAGLDAAREFETRGYQVVGHVDNDGDLLGGSDHPLLGPIARLDEIVESLGIDELVVAIANDRSVELRRVLTRGFARVVQVKYAADIGDLRLPPRFSVRRIGKRQYIDFAPVAPVGWAKRAMDLAIAVTGLVVLLPVFVAIAVAIKLESPGPAFYRQVRVGKDRRFFSMLKFRSMRQDAEALIGDLLGANEVSGPMFKIRRDPRITRVGRILRRASLDELPQLINVVRGDMSLVGPRPPLAAEVKQYQDWEIGRLRAVPGITGLWQISGRTEVGFQDMVRLDLHYIRNWSFALDVLILLRTIPAVLLSKGAY